MRKMEVVMVFLFCLTANLIALFIMGLEVSQVKAESIDSDSFEFIGEFAEESQASPDYREAWEFFETEADGQDESTFKDVVLLSEKAEVVEKSYETRFIAGESAFWVEESERRSRLLAAKTKKMARASETEADEDDKAGAEAETCADDKAGVEAETCADDKAGAEAETCTDDKAGAEAETCTNDKAGAEAEVKAKVAEVREALLDKQAEEDRRIMEKAPYTEDDIYIVAQILQVEDGNNPSETRRSAVIWTILDRVDAGHGSIMEVATAPYQFDYRPAIVPSDANLILARDVLNRWYAEKRGFVNSGRTLPVDYLYFTGNGRENFFRNKKGEVYRWALESPYDS